MIRRTIRFLFCLTLVHGVFLHGQVKGQVKQDTSEPRKRNIIDTLFDNLDSVDSRRFRIDSFISVAVDNYYQLPRPDRGPKHEAVRGIKASLNEFDYIRVALPESVRDSMKIELKDYRNGLSNYYTASLWISDSSGQIGEANMRSYEDARFRLLFARSSILRALNSYQSLIKEDVLEDKSDTLHRGIDLGFRRTDSVLAYTDSLISKRDTFSNIISGTYISNELFGVGWLHLFGKQQVMAVGGDLFYQTGTSHNGINGRPTYQGMGGDAEFGLRFLRFLFAGGLSVLQVPRAVDNTNLTFRPVTLMSWHGGIFYHYNKVGFGFIYSPLYGAGIRFQYWL